MYRLCRLRRFARLFSLLSALLPAARAVAQLPLNIEELLVEESVLKLETGTAFRHGEDYVPAVGSGRGALAQPWPVKRELEVMELSSSLRYGAGRAVEVNATALASRLRWRQAGASVGDERRQSLDVGVNWLALAENTTPALLLQLGGRLLDRSSMPGVDSRTGGAWRIAATAYRSLDPVVLSLALGCEWRRSREVDGERLDPGDIAWLAPQLNFAVNPQVTLIAGTGLYVTGGDRLSGHRLSRSSSLSNLRLGLGLAPSPRSTVFFEADFAASGARYARFALDWVYRF